MPLRISQPNALQPLINLIEKMFFNLRAFSAMYKLKNSGSLMNLIYTHIFGGIKVWNVKLNVQVCGRGMGN